MGGFGGFVSDVRVVSNDATRSTLTGTGANTSETILKSVTLPALKLGSVIDIDTLFSWTSSANTKTFRIRLGGIGGAIVFQAGQTTSQHQQQKTIIYNRDFNSQLFLQNTVNGGYTGSSAAVNTSAIDTSVSTTLVFTGQLNAGAALALESVSYEAATVKVIL